MRTIQVLKRGFLLGKLNRFFFILLFMVLSLPDLYSQVNHSYDQKNKCTSHIGLRGSFDPSLYVIPTNWDAAFPYATGVYYSKTDHMSSISHSRNHHPSNRSLCLSLRLHNIKEHFHFLTQNGKVGHVPALDPYVKVAYVTYSFLVEGQIDLFWGARSAVFSSLGCLLDIPFWIRSAGDPSYPSRTHNSELEQQCNSLQDQYNHSKLKAFKLMPYHPGVGLSFTLLGFSILDKLTIAFPKCSFLFYANGSAMFSCSVTIGYNMK
ncbi:MAG: hypothetical protein K2X94_02590 [Amoebophilaceae bacterium]|nr:hypothetical protein [Amoebophilaceae bacterium]